jgi:hypothetical protein
VSGKTLPVSVLPKVAFDRSAKLARGVHVPQLRRRDTGADRRFAFGRSLKVTNPMEVRETPPRGDAATDQVIANPRSGQTRRARTPRGIATVSHGGFGATEASKGSTPREERARRRRQRRRTAYRTRLWPDTATWRGCLGDQLHGYETASRGRSRAARSASNGSTESNSAGNATNPKVGSRMQQACDRRAEKTVEVVQNHEDGTGLSRWHLGSRSADRKVRAGVDARRQVDEGATNPTGGGR